MATPKVQLGWDNRDLQNGAAQASGIVSRFAAGTRKALSFRTDFGSSFGQVAGAVGALAGLKSVLDGYDRLLDLSLTLDQSVESLQRLGMIAKLSGSDVETLAKGVTKMTRGLAEAESSEKVSKALKDLGISASQLRSMSIEEQIFALGDAFVNARSRGEGFTQVIDLMGRSGAELIPTLLDVRANMESISKVPVLTKDQIQSVADFNDILDLGIGTMKAWVAQGLLAAGDTAAVLAAAMSPDVTMDEAIDALAQTKVEAENLAIENEKNAKLAREQADWAKKVADAQEAARKSIEEGAKALAEQEKRMKGIQDQIDKQTESNKRAQMTPEEELDFAKDKVGDIDKQIADEKGLSAGADQEKLLQLELERQKALGDVISLEQQITREKERQAQAESEKQEKQHQARGDLASELEIMALKARGRDKQAAALEREVKIQQDAKRIAEETGMSAEQALQAAKAKADLEGKINKRQETGRKRIHGFSFKDAGIPAFTGLAGWEALQKGTTGSRTHEAFFRGTDTRFNSKPGNSAQDVAAKTLAAAAAKNRSRSETKSDNSVNLSEGVQIVQLLTEIREGIGEFVSV